MKPRIFTHIAAMTMFGALVASFPLAAQAQANSLPPAPRKYTVQVLPGLGGVGSANSINNLAWVAGLSNPPSDGYEHAFLWRNGQPTDLGTLGGYNSSGFGMNEIGWLVGPSETAEDDPNHENFCGFYCPPSMFPVCATYDPLKQKCRGVLWESKTNKMIELPPLPGGNNSIGESVNNQRQMVGAAENGVMDTACVEGPPELSHQVSRYEGVVWSLGPDGTPFVSQRLAPIVGDTVSFASGINEHGDIVGASWPCAPLFPYGMGVKMHAVLWEDGRAIDLGNLGGDTSNVAFWLNSEGQIVGTSGVPSGDVHAFLWEEGEMKDLGTLRSDDTFASAEFINDKGEVVGISCGPNDCHGFHWQDGVMTDLNSVLPVGSPLIMNADGINSRGEISAQACTLPCQLQNLVAAVLIPSGNDSGALGGVAETKIVQGNVILPENVREMLRRRMGLGGFKLGR
jgi:probable HAF family extracellular repeat protein